MPIKMCTLPSGKQGWKYGDSGKCYPSKKKAIEQAAAIHASGWKEPAQSTQKVLLSSLVKAKFKTNSIKAVDEHLNTVQSTVDALLKRQLKKVLSKYSKTLKVGKMDLITLLKSDNGSNSNTDWVDAIILTDSTFTEDFSANMYTIFKEGGLDSINKLNLEEVVSTKQLNKLALQYAKEHSAELVTMINGTTRDVLKQEISKAIADGLSASSLSKNIEESTAFNKARSDTIARTEIVNAHIQGNVQVWEESGVVAKIEWFTARNERVCGICSMNHMKVVENGKQFPSGAFHPPAHPRCRCDLLPVLKKD